MNAAALNGFSQTISSITTGGGSATLNFAYTAADAGIRKQRTPPMDSPMAATLRMTVRMSDSAERPQRVLSRYCFVRRMRDNRHRFLWCGAAGNRGSAATNNGFFMAAGILYLSDPSNGSVIDAADNTHPIYVHHGKINIDATPCTAFGMTGRTAASGNAAAYANAQITLKGLTSHTLGVGATVATYSGIYSANGPGLVRFLLNLPRCSTSRTPTCPMVTFTLAMVDGRLNPVYSS